MNVNHAAVIVAAIALAPLGLAPAAFASPSRPPPPDAAPRLDDDRHDDRRDDGSDDDRDRRANRGRHHDQHDLHDGLERGCAPDVDDGFADVDAALRALAADAARLHGRAGRAVRGDVDEVFAAVAVAREHACRAAARPAVPVVVAPPPPPPVHLLDEGAEQRLDRALHAEAFDTGRLRVLSTALRGDICVTSAQARGFMSAWAFSSGRAEALRTLAPRIVDDGEAYTIVAGLPFEADKRAAHEILEHTPVLPSCRGYR